MSSHLFETQLACQKGDTAESADPRAIAPGGRDTKVSKVESVEGPTTLTASLGKSPATSRRECSCDLQPCGASSREYTKARHARVKAAVEHECDALEETTAAGLHRITAQDANHAVLFCRQA